MIPGLHVGCEALTFQGHCFQTHMNQKLQPILCAESIGVKGICHRNHLAAHRADNLSLCGDHCDTISDYLLGKYRIRHLLQRNGPACKGRQNGNTSVSAFIAAHLI